MKCDNCNAEYILAKAPTNTPSMQPQSSGPAEDAGFPKVLYNHLFKSKQELDDYERRDREREANLDGSDAANQATLQPGQTDVKTLNRAQLEDVLADLGRNGKSAEVFRAYGPTKLLHPLSNFMTAAGISDLGTISGDAGSNGFVVPPEGWPELGDMTVDRAQYLAGLA